MKTVKKKFSLTSAETTEVSLLESLNPKQSLSANEDVKNVRLFGIMLAIVDIFILPGMALCLSIQTIGMSAHHAEYAVCPGTGPMDCLCANTAGDLSHEMCVRDSDHWYHSLFLFAIVFGFGYEGLLLLLQLCILAYMMCLSKHSHTDAIIIGVIGVRKIYTFNRLNFLLRLMEFAWLIIMVMTYKEITECFCSDATFELSYSNAFYRRRSLDVWCEIVMIVIMIHLVGRRIMLCLLGHIKRMDSNRTTMLWLRMYIKEEKQTT